MNDFFELKMLEGRLVLTSKQMSQQAPVYVDFLAGKSHHRRQYGGGKGQLIARAVGVKRYGNPSVLDITAGLGADAFVVACLGCKVTMLERNPTVAALLRDGLERFFKDPVSEGVSLQLQESDALTYLRQLSPDNRPDVIYVDPMFPHSKKTAEVKKEMRMLRQLVGDDPDIASAFEYALQVALKRVVVKRPRLAPLISEREPDLVFKGQSGRFDVYLLS